MSTPSALDLFGQANDLWFVQGKSRQALALYREAAAADPSDPVILFQLARALRAYSKLEEARAALASAREHGDRLSPFGRQLLDREAARMAEPAGFRSELPAEEGGVGVEELDGLALAPDRWLDLAFAAREREMYGLAVQALRRATGSFRVRELDEDEREVERDAAKVRNWLAVMRAEGEPSTAPPSEERVSPTPLIPLVRETPRPPEEGASRPAPPTPALAEPPPPPPAAAGKVGLDLVVTLHPESTAVREPVTLRVQLTNRGVRPVAVNKRLLFNHASSPPLFGEISLRVEGPVGYHNLVEFHVRAGPPGPDDFEVLLPGASTTREYPLLKYESLHLPGAYRATVTYRNAATGSVKGLPVFLGILPAEPARFERRP